MARRFTRTSRTSRSRPNRSWAGTIVTSAFAVAANSKVQIANLELSNQGIDETILRTHGILTIQSDQLSTSESQIGAFGMIIVTDLAATAGAASIPGPVTNVDDDSWFVHQMINQRMEFASTIGLYPDYGVQYMLDSKAKRVLESGNQISIMIENAHASHGFNGQLTLRVLTQVTGTR